MKSKTNFTERKYNIYFISVELTQYSNYAKHILKKLMLKKAEDYLNK